MSKRHNIAQSRRCATGQWILILHNRLDCSINGNQAQRPDCLWALRTLRQAGVCKQVKVITAHSPSAAASARSAAT
jgi:hypothetical protein